MFILPINKEWLDMIRSGEKREDYREIKPYWTSRIMRLMGLNNAVRTSDLLARLSDDTSGEYEILFRNGYSADAPSVLADCRIRVGEGREEWGAEPGKRYYVFCICRLWY